MIIVVDVNEKWMVRLCENINKNVEDINGEGLTVTVSIGASLYQEHDTQETLISRADKAMYQAKDNGRNTFIFVR